MAYTALPHGRLLAHFDNCDSLVFFFFFSEASCETENGRPKAGNIRTRQIVRFRHLDLEHGSSPNVFLQPQHRLEHERIDLLLSFVPSAMSIETRGQLPTGTNAENDQSGQNR
jgi:hypothetical protein